MSKVESEVVQRQGVVVPVSQVALPVQEQFSKLSVTSDVTSQVILSRLLDSSDGLAVKTNIPDSVSLTILGMLESDCDGLRLPRCRKLYHTFIQGFRENQESLNGWLVEKITQAIVADMANSRDVGGVGEALAGFMRKGK